MDFQTHITPKKYWFDIRLKELWSYRDLILLFVHRNFVALYKQTILGPTWAVLQPLLTTVIFAVIFGKMAGLGPQGVPSFPFYLSGTVLWGYFSSCMTQTGTTFINNHAILGKVYFPRLVMPISTVLSNLISFFIQCIFLGAFVGYYTFSDKSISPNCLILALPLVILQLAAMSLGFGIIIAAFTTKYRDLMMLISFGVQLWMYVTPIAYDIKMIPEKFMHLYLLNPITPVICFFRYAVLGYGEVPWCYYAISWLTTLSVLLIGVMLFNRVEKTFMDTI